VVDTRRPTGTDSDLRVDPLQVPRPASLDEDLFEEEDERRRRPWIQLLLAILVAILAIYWAGQTAARLWLEDLDHRLLDAGAGTNANVNTLERDQLSAYRGIAFADGFAASLARYDARDIERRLTPIDANHGMPMIDIIDDQGRVVFAFRADGAVRPVYRERREVTIVRQALAGETDEYGERFSDLLTTDEGPLLATAGPVRLNGKVVGALLVMTPLDQLLSRSTNYHGSLLTAYSLDRGDPLATTTPIRPRTLGTELRVRLAQESQLPYANRFKIGGKTNREQIGALTLRHRTVAFLGAALPDRSRYVAWRVMVIVTIGLLVMAFLVWTVAYAWAKDKYERDLVAVPKEPLALPPVPPENLPFREPPRPNPLQSGP
jgi:sensor domain CHASE-containing protein